MGKYDDKQDADPSCTAKNRCQGGQLSSDPTSSTIHAVHATPKHYGDHFEFETPRALNPTTPLWDDSNGVIYTTPHIPSRNPTSTYADFIRDGPFANDAPRPAPFIQMRTHASNVRASSFAADVAQPPRGHRAMLKSRARPAQLDPETWTRWHKEFVPYLKPEDVRNAEHLGSATPANDTNMIAHSILGSNYSNQKLRKNETETNTSTGSHEEISKTPAETLKHPASSVKTPQLGFRPIAALIKEPACIDSLNKMRSQPKDHERTSSVTFDKVRLLRAKEEDELSTRFVKLAEPKNSANTTIGPLRPCLRKSTSYTVEPDNTDGLSAVNKVMAISPALLSSLPDSQVKGQSAVPVTVDVDVDPIKAAKCLQNIQDVVTTETEKPAEPTHASADLSVESLSSSGSGGFESIVLPLWDETEKNGGERKNWYSFRK